jgi:hypothetical protein
VLVEQAVSVLIALSLFLSFTQSLTHSLFHTLFHPARGKDCESLCCEYTVVHVRLGVVHPLLQHTLFHIGPHHYHLAA